MPFQSRPQLHRRGQAFLFPHWPVVVCRLSHQGSWPWCRWPASARAVPRQLTAMASVPTACRRLGHRPCCPGGDGHVTASTMLLAWLLRHHAEGGCRVPPSLQPSLAPEQRHRAWPEPSGTPAGTRSPECLPLCSELSPHLCRRLAPLGWSLSVGV